MKAEVAIVTVSVIDGAKAPKGKKQARVDMPGVCLRIPNGAADKYIEAAIEHEFAGQHPRIQKILRKHVVCGLPQLGAPRSLYLIRTTMDVAVPDKKADKVVTERKDIGYTCLVGATKSPGTMKKFLEEKFLVGKNPELGEIQEVPLLFSFSHQHHKQEA